VMPASAVPTLLTLIAARAAVLNVGLMADTVSTPVAVDRLLPLQGRLSPRTCHNQWGLDVQ